MNIIRFTSTLKPSGKEYKKIVYWNRFIRMKLETIILTLLFIAGIFLLFNTKELVLLLMGGLFIVFPIIVIIQLNSSIRYHLDNRDKTESMPCEFTVMQNGILTNIYDENYSKMYKWEESTSVYDALGYYMFFNKNAMTVMINKSDVAESDKKNLRSTIKTNMGKKARFL